MFLAQCLAIGLEGDHAIVQRLFHRNRAPVRRRIGAFDIDPFVFQVARRVQPGLFQQGAQAHAGVFHVVNHAVGELRAVQLCASPFHPGVGCTFQEECPVFTRETLQILVGENQFLIHHPIDHQAIIFFAQFNRTRVVAFKRTALRGDRTVQRMNRGKVDRTDRVSRQPFHVAADHVAFVFDRQAIGRGIHTIAQAHGPALFFGNQGVGGCGAGGACPCDCASRRRQRSFQERAPRRRFTLEADCHLSLPPLKLSNSFT